LLEAAEENHTDLKSDIVSWLKLE